MDERKSQFSVPFYPILPAAAFIISVCLLIPVGNSGFISGFIWLSIGIAIYFLRSKSIKANLLDFV